MPLSLLSKRPVLCRAVLDILGDGDFAEVLLAAQNWLNRDDGSVVMYVQKCVVVIVILRTQLRQFRLVDGIICGEHLQALRFIGQWIMDDFICLACGRLDACVVILVDFVTGQGTSEMDFVALVRLIHKT